MKKLVNASRQMTGIEIYAMSNLELNLFKILKKIVDKIRIIMHPLTGQVEELGLTGLEVYRFYLRVLSPIHP